jgi:hypothetical protein
MQCNMKNKYVSVNLPKSLKQAKLLLPTSSQKYVRFSDFHCSCLHYRENKKKTERALLLLQQGSISPTFYARLFCTKVLCNAFFCLKYGLNFFWHNETAANALVKLLVKLTTAKAKVVESISKFHY